MSKPKRICVAFGTRPEASKMAPVIYALRKQAGLEPIILVTGQHREQLDSMLDIFELKPDHDLDVMQATQRLPDLMARIVPEAANSLRDLEIDYVLVHGDTLTSFAVALAAFFENIPVAHVEAGLRSHNLKEPFPEEGNRKLTDAITDLDLPPTQLAKENLIAEGKSLENMIITGNTAVDGVQYAIQKAVLAEHLRGKSLVTITMHRRENLELMPELAACIAKLAKENPQYYFVYPVHLNPVVRNAVYPALETIDNVLLEEPYDYLNMLALMQASELILTDSGGLQEEGTALGVPVVVMRNVTERPEGVTAGSLKLAGNRAESVYAVTSPLLQDATLRNAMRIKNNPYGDGLAGERIAQAVAWRFGLAEKPKDWQARY